MKSVFLISILLFTLAGCQSETNGNDEKNTPKQENNKTPGDYANDYCLCIEQSENISHCDSIIKEAENVFGIHNKEAEKEFSKQIQECL